MSRNFSLRIVRLFTHTHVLEATAMFLLNEGNGHQGRETPRPQELSQMVGRMSGHKFRRQTDMIGYCLSLTVFCFERPPGATAVLVAEHAPSTAQTRLDDFASGTILVDQGP